MQKYIFLLPLYNDWESITFLLTKINEEIKSKNKIADILVINDDLYLLANLSQMVPLNKKDNSHFVLACPNVYPFPKEVCAPELLEMNALPFISHRSASYYSLALLCLTLLKCSNLSLDKLQGTKLVYFIERCLKKEPMERMCLYF